MAVAIAAVVGLVVGVVLTLMLRPTSRRGSDPTPVGAAAVTMSRESFLGQSILDLLPTSALLVDADDVVRVANSAASRMGVISGDAVVTPELTTLVRAARRLGADQSAELVLRTPDQLRRSMSVEARAYVLEAGDVALVVDDLTESRRVDAVRRDFVANVGHEIKTPVGALQLLAEAALDARDDPDAVRHFVERMQREATRLTRLVQDLIDLSRLQGGEPLPDGRTVAIDAVIDEAVDRAHLAADAKSIAIVRGTDSRLSVVGVESQLVTALSNLLQNAVAYSPNGTKVAVGVRCSNGDVEVSVTDQGIGIPTEEQERIFERFYRVDPARSRATGGTGLGLAIVKHTVGNHGGEVTVWSRPGSGSTFTIRLAAGPSIEEDTTL